MQYFVNREFGGQTHYRPLSSVSLLSIVFVHLKNSIKNLESFITWFHISGIAYWWTLGDTEYLTFILLPHGPQRASILYLVPSTPRFPHPVCTVHDHKITQLRLKLCGHTTMDSNKHQLFMF